jgi:virginiamycin A acetyltransferase
MPNEIPQASSPFPIANQKRVGFLKNHVTRPNIEVGDYTYYDDPAGMQSLSVMFCITSTSSATG